MQTSLISNIISKEIFLEYDIRGIVGKTLTAESVYLIAKAIGKKAKLSHQKKIIIGRDGRLSGPLLSQALKNGLLDAGCEVIDIGAVPTPVLYFAAHILSTQSGIMLTGSHNPVDYNGLKIVINGETLSGKNIQALYEAIITDHLSENISHQISALKKDDRGYSQEPDILEKYITRITQDIKLSQKLTKKLKIVVDAGNGITGIVAPMLYRALGCEVIELFCEIDGRFPHHHPDPSVPENLADLIKAVKDNQADIGLAFDGDGDRLGVVTNQGEIIYPDRQLMLYAQDVLSRHPGAKIIFDVKCTKYLAQMIESSGGVPEMYKTGHSLIKKRMLEEQAPLAGEMSGHIFFKDRWYGFDDGLYTGARLLEILSHAEKTSSEIFDAFPNSINTPELKLPVSNLQRTYLLSQLPLLPVFNQARLITIDGLRAEFEHGWGLIRGSNTTPHLILRFEANNQSNLDQIQQYFRQALLELDHTLILPF